MECQSCPSTAFAAVRHGALLAGARMSLSLVPALFRPLASIGRTAPPRERGDTGRVVAQDNVELVREGYARWRAGGYDLLLDFFLANAAPDIELYSRFGGFSGTPYRGHDGLRAWLAEIQETFERFEPWVDEAREVGDDRVVAIGGISFRARESGVDMAERLGWVYDFRDGRLRRMMFYASPREALEAVGLRG
jgi:ketosteroid isomerase-like protein